MSSSYTITAVTPKSDGAHRKASTNYSIVTHRRIGCQSRLWNLFRNRTARPKNKETACSRPIPLPRLVRQHPIKVRKKAEKVQKRLAIGRWPTPPWPTGLLVPGVRSTSPAGFSSFPRSAWNASRGAEGDSRGVRECADLLAGQNLAHLRNAEEQPQQVV